MTGRPPRVLATLMLAAVVLLAACGPGREVPDPLPTGAPTSTGLAVRDDLVDPQPVTWRSWRAVDATTLEFTVTSGDPSCYGAEARVVESTTAVRVRLRVGRLPEAAERACAAIALESVVLLKLASPLGTRQVLRLE